MPRLTFTTRVSRLVHLHPKSCLLRASPAVPGRWRDSGAGARLGKRIAGAENVDDLFLAGGGDPMDVHGAALNYVKAVRGIAFVKQVTALALEWF